MRAFEKKELVIWDWYFTGRMEMISTKEKVKEERNGELLLNLCKQNTVGI